MKLTSLVWISLTLAVILCSGCVIFGDRDVYGNGVQVVEERNFAGFEKISVAGDFEVTLVQQNDFGISITADENLIPFIYLDTRNEELRIRVQKGVDLHSKKAIKIRVGLPELKSISQAGSGKVKVEGEFEGKHKLELHLAGSGSITAQVHVPKVTCKMAGSGQVFLAGETRDIELKIAGSGELKAEDLKAETAKVKIAGSGSAWVFASIRLDVSIAGSAQVHYKGNPRDIDRSIAGSGELIALQ